MGYLDTGGLARFFTGLKNKFVDQANTLTTAQIQAILESQQSPVNVVSADVDAVIAAAKLAVYPVGSYYQSDDPTSPAVLFGGTWEAVHGRFLLAEGENEANTDETYGSLTAGVLNTTAGDMSGEAEHALNDGELPTTTGRLFIGNGGTGASGSGYGAFRGPDNGMITYDSVAQYGKATQVTTLPSGAGTSYQYASFLFGNDESHNNMPPFVAVYTWHRIA